MSLVSKIYFFVLIVVFSFKFSLVRCSEMVALITISRHGQKAPDVNLPNDTRKIKWPVESGQLLNSGKVLHYDLGKWFRERYRTFLSEKYSPKDIYVQSTDVDRVLMSAYSNMAGLYLPKGNDIWMQNINWQPIPVHTMPDYYLVAASPSYKTFFSLWTNYVKKSQEIYNEENKKLFQYISKNLGKDVANNPMNLISYYDTLYAQKYNGIQLPKWVIPVYDKWTQVVELLYHNMANTTELTQMSLGGFAGHMINHFDSVINGTNKYKSSMNFGHDINIAGLLNILTHNKPILPFYGSTILFELYKISDKYYLKMILKDKNKPVEMKIKGCGVKCDYKLARRILIKYAISEEDWKKMCFKKDQE